MSKCCLFVAFFVKVKKKMQLWKVKYVNSMILDVKFTGVSKATNQRARLILLGTDWLNPKDQRYD